MRKRRRLTQRQLADRMRTYGHPTMTDDAVSEIKIGKREVTVDELFLFAAALQTPVVRLCSPSSDDDTKVLVNRLYQSVDLRNWMIYGDAWLPPAQEAQRGMAIAQTAAAVLNPRLDEKRRTTARTRLLELLHRR
jgi:transcriptional regulator with XRE-family HTH domain